VQLSQHFETIFFRHDPVQEDHVGFPRHCLNNRLGTVRSLDYFVSELLDDLAHGDADQSRVISDQNRLASRCSFAGLTFSLGDRFDRHSIRLLANINWLGGIRVLAIVEKFSCLVGFSQHLRIQWHRRQPVSATSSCASIMWR
jgi:hypothetical protein